MEDKNYPVIYNPEHYTVMANDIVHGKQDMTLKVLYDRFVHKYQHKMKGQ